jgi:predicted naringenin-chalcone synthase
MLIDISTSVPPYKVDQAVASAELKKRMAPESPVIQRLIDMASSQSGISSRYIVVPDADASSENKFYTNGEVHVSPDTKNRMQEYEKWSKYLVKNAVEGLIKKTNVNPSEIERLITVSCTGFYAPGFDHYIVEQFNLPKTVKRTHIGFMGCAASIIGFNSVLESLALDQESNILLVSCEICSLHLQLAPTRDNILSNMIFADGAAAALFSRSEELSKKRGLKIINTQSVLFPSSADYMGWKIGNNGFEMILSSELPKIILNQAVPTAVKMLESMGVKKESVKHWALHPGGRAILDSLQKGLCLSDEEMQPSRRVLNNYGNTSSVSILFVLNEFLREGKLEKGESLCAIAFGPGLSMEMALFKVT